MRFNVYLPRFGKLIKLYKIHRGGRGLYIWSHRSRDYISYHEDGKYWMRFRGKKTVKKIRQPLSAFNGAETISVAVTTILAPGPYDEDESVVRVMPEDIVIDFAGNFGVEIILSAERIDLPQLPQRPNRIVHIKDSQVPVIIIEAFEILDNVFPFERYRSDTQWVEGRNFFVNHEGRI